MDPENPDQPAQEAGAQQAPGQAPAADDAAAKLAAKEKELKEARAEAAKYRTALRSQEQAQADAEQQRLKEQGEYQRLYEQAQQELAGIRAEQEKTTRQLAQQQAAQQAGLPLDMASRLVGATPEELLADAQALAKHLLKPAAPSTGATNPAAQRGEKPAVFDPKNPPRLTDIWKR